MDAQQQQLKEQVEVAAAYAREVQRLAAESVDAGSLDAVLHAQKALEKHFQVKAQLDAIVAYVHALVAAEVPNDVVDGFNKCVVAGVPAEVRLACQNDARPGHNSSE